MLARDAVMMNFGPKSKTCGRQNSAIHFLNSPNPTPSPSHYNRSLNLAGATERVVITILIIHGVPLC